MSPSDTHLKELANRLEELGDELDLETEDFDLIKEATRALLHADDVITASGLFAQAVADPVALRFAWAAGQKPFDPEAALKQLGKAANYIMAAVEKALFGGGDEDVPPELPDLKPFYRVRVSSAEVRIESSLPLPVDEVCAMALRMFTESGTCLGPVMEVSRCAEHAGPDQIVFVSTQDQLRKAGLLASERREA